MSGPACAMVILNRTRRSSAPHSTPLQDITGVELLNEEAVAAEGYRLVATFPKSHRRAWLAKSVGDH